MTEEVYLGIDTSCYTTSLFFMDRQGNKAAEARRILKVKPGGCGLQQSEMIYQHIRNLPELMEEAAQGHTFSVLGIGVSARPRPREDSYMPAFLAGLGFARSLAALYGIPLWQISHQENHLEAARWSAHGPAADRFLFLHASGGTTDLLLVEKQITGPAPATGGEPLPEAKDAVPVKGMKPVSGYHLTEIGGSLDLHAGQFVDRVGVALGLPFPAGPALEQVAAQHTEIPEIPVSVHKTNVSLSGPCTWVLRAIEKVRQGAADPATVVAQVTTAAKVTAAAPTQAVAPEAVAPPVIAPALCNLAAGVQWGLAETFVRMIRNGAAEYHVQDVILAGGVCANCWIRTHIEEKLARRRIRVWMPENRYSGDNASGCAAYARRQGEQHG
ncbi:MAG: O-sialoglycoprotein endopeptidase [Acidaminococcaceae bacterium]|nr:O-sialoglycoprotein endopeptidase [Acidaminococcaceae bacterium]